jgi:hypothetical protein
LVHKVLLVLPVPLVHQAQPERLALLVLKVLLALLERLEQEQLA